MMLPKILGEVDILSRKIIVLNGSPRAKGNTSALVEEFSRGAREFGCDVEIFFLDKMNIHGCKGCFGGGKNFEHPCVQKDDMEKIYPAYRAADVVLLTILFNLKIIIILLFLLSFIKELIDILKEGYNIT